MDPATSGGMSRKLPARRGENPRSRRYAVAAKAMTRLVAPVVPDTPTIDGLMLMPAVPSSASDHVGQPVRE